MLNFETIRATDPEIYELIKKEEKRQRDSVELIASENIPSDAVLEAQASYHALKYAEGYPNARYYAGCENIDETEQLAIDRACELFHCNFANVQPHSGAQANAAVQFALLKPGEKLMGMSLNSGGHLTHGANPTFSGKYFKVVQYDVDPQTYLIDYDKLEKVIRAEKPRLFIAGASAYPRYIDFSKMRDIIDKVNASIKSAHPEDYELKKIYFMVDMAHIAGLVATGLHPSPLPYADVVTTTTHKTLRGPRGGLILWNDKSLTPLINSAVFPGTQGGPLEHIVAAKAVCFKEALSESFVLYQQQVVRNAKILASVLSSRGIDLVTDGTDNHLVLINLKKEGITGAEVEERLANINIITNKNAIPFDSTSKKLTSGLRVGTPAVTSRGFKEKEIIEIGDIIADIIHCTPEEYESYQSFYKKRVKKILKKFPLKRNFLHRFLRNFKKEHTF